MPYEPSSTPLHQQEASRMPMTPAKSEVEKGPYRAVPAHNTPRAGGLTPLQKHTAFFDRNNDGILTPRDTWASFRDLGYGLVLSTLGTIVIHLFFSYPTLDTWVPDPLFSVHLDRIHRCIHGSHTGTYNSFGEIEQTSHVQTLVARFDATGKRGLTLREYWGMLSTMRNILDPFGWLAAILEWGFLWVLVAEDGVVPVDAILGQYDGSLFYSIREKRRQQQQHN